MNMKKECPKCKFIIFDLEVGVLLGKPMEYWIDLDTRIIEQGTEHLYMEIIRLKSRVFDAEEKLKQISKIST
ncbi:MAG: hypothetical protein ACUZ8I_05075 [Candidatus Scalindua sp.]